MKLWGGRFESPIDERFGRFNDSFSFDCELIAEDVAGSIAWCASLVEAGVLLPDEGDSLSAALGEILVEAGSGPLPLDDYEDVHSWVESRLHEKAGALAAKLHTGRSRNDQVATDLRLWLRNAAREAHTLTLSTAKALATRSAAEAATAMPGYTHLKAAEPVTFGHWCGAYAEMLLRDAGRFASAIARGNECPLGSGALAGTPLSIDRDTLATRLGFDRATANSLDGVSDRDFGAEYLFAATLLFQHLSRLSEDLIFFSTDEVGFVELPDALATGSSRMPQKKNPDLLELVRGHAGRTIGELTGFLALLKGLPLAYDKDLQLDKEPLFRTRKVIAGALPLIGSLVERLGLNRERMRLAASHDLLLATQLTDSIAARGIAFRDAHEIVSRRIGESAGKGMSLAEMGPTKGITSDDLQALDIDRALARKSAKGGTAPERVGEAAKALLEKVEKMSLSATDVATSVADGGLP